ncbi:MAG TPA: ABC transporter permease subunit [Caproicibacter sp.]|nr:ABC transporter permease subunit [Caproicibacter sp.]
MKIISNSERAVVKKDFSEIWDSKMARSTLLVLPVLLVVVIPIMFLVIIGNVPLNQMNGLDRMMQMLPQEAKSFAPRQSLYYLMTNSLFPMFFLMIPLMTSSVAAASSFVGEKERGTLETLILTPLNLKQIFKAKVLGCIFLSAAVTALSFLLFAVIISIGDISLGMPFFLNWNWLVLILFLTPGITVFGVVFMVLVSAKSKSYIESIQTSGYIILPLILMFVGQFTGLFTLNAIIFLIVSALVILADIPIWMLTARSFTAEKLLK